MSDASGTHVFDVRNRRWCHEILETLNITEQILPDEVAESSELTGYIADEIAGEIGLRGGVAVVGGGGDAVLQLAASGSTDPSKLCILIGTSGVVGLTVDELFENSEGILQFYCNVMPGRRMVFGCTLAAGGSLEWFRRLSPTPRRPWRDGAANQSSIYFPRRLSRLHWGPGDLLPAVSDW